jgi:hypothetical protein
MKKGADRPAPGHIAPSRDLQAVTPLAVSANCSILSKFM